MAKAKVLALTKRAVNALGIDPAFYSPEYHGVTYSLLTKFKNCRERARLHLIGWTPTRIGFSLVFGTVIHAVLEEIYTQLKLKTLDSLPSDKTVTKIINHIGVLWRQENPKADPETMQHLELALGFATVMMPVYFKFWSKDFNRVQWLKLEHEFRHELLLAGGRKTFVRGKMDGVFKPDSSTRPWLFETKTKSRLGESGESNLVEILPYELQINLYLGVLQELDKVLPGGATYNIIRRPMLKQSKTESMPAFLNRVQADVRHRPDYYFIRMRMTVDRKDLERERAQQTQLIEDFVAWYHGGPHYKNSDHCENKYGTCEMIRVCSSGDTSRLYKRPSVFRELED